MKTLVIDMAHFRLPDDFDGSIAEALRLMADYHDKRSKTSPPKNLAKSRADVLLEQPLKTARASVFDMFLDHVVTGGRLTGVIQIASYNPKVPLEKVDA